MIFIFLRKNIVNDISKQEAERLGHLLDDAFVKCNLPPKPDYQKAEQLLISILKQELHIYSLTV